jgi:hypothetical protein
MKPKRNLAVQLYLSGFSGIGRHFEPETSDKLAGVIAGRLPMVFRLAGSVSQGVMGLVQYL